MNFVEECIRNNLGMIQCPNGECEKVAPKTAIKLLGERCRLIEKAECRSLEEAEKKIDEFLSGNSLAIIWIDAGPKDRNNYKYRAMHFHTIYSSNPLNSFSVWPDTGLAFYNEVQVKNKIKEAISFFELIRIQRYGIRTKL
jgi:hypothetical protein